MKYKLVWNAALLEHQPDEKNDQVQVFSNAVSFENLSQTEEVAQFIYQQLLQGFKTHIQNLFDQTKEIENVELDSELVSQ